MFSGMSNHSVDAKGRIVLPAKFREELGESFYIARGFGNPCIQAMSKEQFDVLFSRIMELPADKAMALQYSFTATAVEVAPNASGRVMLPQALREFAKIEGDALVIGMNNRIEIWSSKRFEQFIESQKDTIAEALTMLRL
ncbi:MAG: division/cell wall cluster transcriptional repressor MraZ [Ruminococcus sp.]|nr:division/cell wall cluster transcriptional repressor MraZ [Ruminococcus sp.]